MAFQPGVRVTGMNAALAALAKYAPKEMQKASRRATMAGVKVAAKLIRAAAPKGKTGRLRKSVRARAGNVGYAAAYAKPRAHHAHLVIRGHRIVTPGGRDTGRRAKSNPFVDRATDAGRLAIVEAVKRELYRK